MSMQDKSIKNLNRFYNFSSKLKKKQKKHSKSIAWHSKHTICKADKPQTIMSHKLAKGGSQLPKQKLISKNVL